MTRNMTRKEKDALVKKAADIADNVQFYGIGNVMGLFFAQYSGDVPSPFKEKELIELLEMTNKLRKRQGP